MSADLIEYLVEYCVSRGRKSMRYIETVALAWAKDGITTVEMAGCQLPFFQGLLHDPEGYGDQRPQSC